MSLASHDDDRLMLHLELEVDLDGVPVTGRLRGRHGEDEPFVGWLGFVDALRRMREQIINNRRSDAMSTQTHPQHAARPATAHGPILVVGATGKTGRRVAERLTALADLVA